jgi:hypothetical protein
MRKVLLTLVISLPLLAICQTVVDVDKNDNPVAGTNLFFTIGGVPFSSAKYIRVVEGTPYFSGEWMKGVVTLSKNGRTGSILVKLNLVDNALHYLDTKGDEMIVDAPVKQVVINDTLQQLVFTFRHASEIVTGTTENAYYQLLRAGEPAVYKKINKQINETKPYGSATTEQRIVTTIEYYIFRNGELHRIKKIREVADLLSDKRSQLLQYISKNKLYGKADEDYTSLLEYYQSLR